MSEKTTISAVVPVFNEEKNLLLLYKKLKKSLTKISQNYEIIFVNDGSKDNSEKVLKNIYQKNKKISLILFDKNYGKTAALEAAINLARGRLIITLDSDLQHDPEEIPRLVKKINQGYDLVIGWRKKRRDPLYRIIFSKMVNFAVRLLTGFKIHDFYCGFKGFKREIVEQLGLHADLYRFIAYLAYQKGFRVTEVPVTYHYRRFGRSKYGFGLLKRAVHDLLIIFFVIKNLQKGQYQIKETLKRR